MYEYSLVDMDPSLRPFLLYAAVVMGLIFAAAWIIQRLDDQLHDT